MGETGHMLHTHGDRSAESYAARRTETVDRWRPCQEAKAAGQAQETSPEVGTDTAEILNIKFERPVRDSSRLHTDPILCT